MSELPTGIVTFLLTDVEESTPLWEDDPSAMRRAIARHDEIIAEGVRCDHGMVIKSRGEGDSVFAVFRRARDAVLAACRIQRALHREPWTTPRPLRARIAVHTGEAERRAGDYYGPEVNRCARIRELAHGGQILISAAVYELVRGEELEPLSFKDLGWHRLEGLRQPIHIYQLVHPDLPADFPPLQSPVAIPNNLPVQLTSFIGRAREMAEVERLLRERRLLTLHGTGGCGKTRLAVEIASDLLSEYPDGVWLVELSSTLDPALVPQAVASTLGVREEPDRPLLAREERGRPLLDRLIDHLQPKKLLLILDNCEHLVDACARLAEALLQSCPHLNVLATSRSPLGIAGETVRRVPSLSTPDPKRLPPLNKMREYEAVQLFVERAQAVSPAFELTRENAPIVAEICHRLDGIPLAIELAAARVKILSAEQIAARLGDRFRLLTGGSRTALPRQQTLQAMIDWSYNLLSESERALLRRLSVFSGGFTLEATEAICVDDLNSGAEREDAAVARDHVLDLLTQLVDKSLVVVDERGDEARHRLLETVRQYALEKLVEANEAEPVRRRHRDWFLALAERAEPELILGPRHASWLDCLELEHDNLRIALEWSLTVGETDAFYRLVGALWRFWEVRGYLSEGRNWLTAALERCDDVPPKLRVKALLGAGVLAWYQDDYQRATKLLHEALRLYRRLGDKMGVALALIALGSVATSQGDYQAARERFAQSLDIFRELNMKEGVANVLLNLGTVIWRQGEHEQATALHEESLDIFRTLEHTWGIAVVLVQLGAEAWRQGEYDRATALSQEALDLFKELGHKWGIGHSLYILGLVAQRQGDQGKATELLRESLTLQREMGDRGGMARCMEGLAEVACARGDDERAAKLFGAAEALREQIGAPLPPTDRAHYERHLEAARIRLGEEAFQTAWLEAQSLTLESALQLALHAG